MSTRSTAFAGHFDRAEDDLEESTLDRRHVTEIYDYMRLLFARVGIP